MNWGTKIVITFILFCGLMIAMVVTCFKQDFHLVTEDYYQEELNYQTRMNEIRNASQVDREQAVLLEERKLILDLPGNPVAGQVHFYRPDNAHFDRKMNFSGGQSVLETGDLVAGRYTLKIGWQDQGMSYYFEKDIFLMP